MADVDYLYKYATFKAACDILTSKELLWSCPVVFNDPFDCKGRITSYSDEEYHEAFFRIIKDECNGQRTTRISPDLNLYSIVELIRNSDVVKKGVEISKLKPKIKKIVPNGYNSHVEKLEKKWESGRNREIFVFCLTNNPDNILMWSHYADYHKGVLLKFKNTDNENSLVSAAKQVEYVDEIVAFSTDPTCDAKVHLKICDKDYYDMYFKAIFSKGKAWQLEGEYRCIASNTDKMSIKLIDENRALINFNPQELDSIYLGCMMTPEDQKKLKKLLVGDFSHVKPFQSKMDEKEYKLIYEPA